MKDPDPFLDEPFLPRWSLPWWSWLLAGFGAVLVIAGTVKMLQPQMDERLYARFRKLPQAVFIPPGDSCCPDLSEASRLFNQKKYTKALAQFEKSDPRTYTGEVQLYSGICYLELNQMTKAESAFSPVLNQPSALGDEAAWYTALSRLRRHDRKGCTDILMKITPEKPRYETARQLLERGLK